MAKLVKLTASDNQAIYVNSETVRAILPKGSNSLIIHGDLPLGVVEVRGSPDSIASKMVG